MSENKPIACLKCGEDFTPFSKKSKFCRISCGQAYRKKRKPYKKRDHAPIACAVCGDMFKPLAKTRINCSKKCIKTYMRNYGREYRKRHDTPDRPEIECVECGELFRPKSYKVKNCSQKCRDTADDRRQENELRDPPLVYYIHRCRTCACRIDDSISIAEGEYWYCGNDCYSIRLTSKMLSLRRHARMPVFIDDSGNLTPVEATL